MDRVREGAASGGGRRGYIEELFGRRGRPGIAMASRALRLAMPEEAVEILCTAYTARLIESARPRR